MPPFRPTAETFTPGARTLPQRYFTSDDVFAQEQERIFSTHWLCVGHQSQIARAGDYFLAQVAVGWDQRAQARAGPPFSSLAPVAGESLIILRDRQATIRGLYNVCRHRGTRLCEEPSGQLPATIQCPYHAWTYALDGRLVGAPHMGEVAGFDKAQYSLSDVALGLWEGFIFVNLAIDPQPLQTVFAPLAGKFAHWNLPKLKSAKRIEYLVRANWKLIFENFSECYHCPLVHPALARLTPYDAAENDLSEGPFLGGFMPIIKGSLTTSGDACALPVGDISAENHRRVFYYSIFPNMLLSLHPDYVMVHQLWPQSHASVRILCDWFFHPDAFGRPDFRPAGAIEFWDQTNRQDWHVCELSQQGIASRAYKSGPYSPRESIPAAWDRHYLRALGE